MNSEAYNIATILAGLVFMVIAGVTDHPYISIAVALLEGALCISILQRRPLQ